MRRSLLLLAFLAVPAFATDHHFSVTIDTGGDEEVTDCSQINIRFDERPALRAEEVVPAAGLRSLKVDVGRSGGVRISGWDSPEYSIKACKAAAQSDALRDLRVRLDGSTLTSNNSDEGIVYFLVRAPRNATLDLEARNGEISVHDVHGGSITAHAKNGPISVKQTQSASVKVTTENGPIMFAGSGGTVSLRAENGPITVKLSGDSWNGSLDAQTQNGPLSLKIPRNYHSGVMAEVLGHGPISCHAEDCAKSPRSWNDEDESSRQIKLGTGAVVVKLTTNNGPLSIKEKE